MPVALVVNRCLITIAPGVAYTALRLFTDLASGIFERFQPMPIARSGVLWAHVLTSLVSLAVVMGVALIRIHTLAAAGVPLARVPDLLEAGPEQFADGIGESDKKPACRDPPLPEHPGTVDQVGAGAHLALPRSVVGYLDRLRDLGVGEQYIELERGHGIKVADVRFDRVPPGRLGTQPGPAVRPPSGTSTAHWRPEPPGPCQARATAFAEVSLCRTCPARSV